MLKRIAIGFSSLALGTAVSMPAAAGTVSLFDGGGHLSVPVKSFAEVRFKGVVRQQYDFSCGSAALATLLSYHYGYRVNEQTVFQTMYESGDRVRIQQKGFSLLDMKRYVEQRGFRANGYRVTLDDMQKTKIPGIALVTFQGYRHFVVIKGVRDNRVLVGDPARGLRSFSRPEFEAGWNGVIFAISGGPKLLADGFNRAQEWATVPDSPLQATLERASLSNFILSLPTPGDF